MNGSLSETKDGEEQVNLHHLIFVIYHIALLMTAVYKKKAHLFFFSLFTNKTVMWKF